MIDKLPYTLTNGVTATREGLEFDTEEQAMFIGHYYAGRESLIATWPDAAARLLITEEVQTSALVYEGVIMCTGRKTRSLAPKVQALQRIAAILCDGAEAFRVLYWCVTNLGGNNEV